MNRDGDAIPQTDALMIQWLADWFDQRTGYRQVMHEALYENIPGGSRWAYVFGSMLVFAFVTQLITGIFLWMFYSAGSQNAWESVYYIQNELQGGWFLRGVHHFMAQAMVVLLPLHLLQVVFWKAYVKPREINYWLGLVLMQITLALGLTGYLLPWDQKGYWATKVATELMSLPPGGAYIQKLVVGGDEYGHYTLTRFFALHAGVLPALLIAILALHVAMFRKHGITTGRRVAGRTDEYFWPAQVFKDAVACLVLLVVVVGLVLYGRGAELGPPAEPTEAYGAARPEWYYLFLFQLLKHAPTEFIGAIVIPGAVMAALFLLPIIAKVRYGHLVNVITLLILILGAAYLTGEAIYHDNYARMKQKTPSGQQARALHQERWDASETYWAARERAEREYERVRELVRSQGIPKQGANLGLVRNDPEIQGPRIFIRNCASCHSHLNPAGHGINGPKPPRDEDGIVRQDAGAYGAPNLYRFASRGWIAGLLDPKQIAGSDYFGPTAHGQKIDGAYKAGGMVEFVTTNLADLSEEKQQEIEQVVAALSAEAKLVYQREDDKNGSAAIQAGRKAFSESFACTDCHKLGEQGDLGTAPDLTGYGSADWLRAFLANPAHERFYPSSNDRMPAFARDPQDPSKSLLTSHELDMLVRWLRGDDE